MFQGIIVQESDPGFKVVELCHYNDGDYDYYAFVAVNPEKYPVFKKAYRKGNNIKISGVEVIYEAEGKVPTLDIIRKVTEKYDIRKEITDPVVRRAMSSMSSFERTENTRRSA